ncbi:MAG TPA: hypothetical protein VG893_00675 [Terracidiphilus sp.]|nr:hypothetical protein [Terracidiphilus sp.]
MKPSANARRNCEPALPRYRRALSIAQGSKTYGRLFFLMAFLFSCFLFWWLPSVLFRFIVHIPDPVNNATIVLSIAGLALFIAGFHLPMPYRTVLEDTPTITRACGDVAYKATVFLFPAALMAALYVMHTQSQTIYGSASPIPRPCQALFYTHLFFGFAYFGAAEPRRDGWQKVAWTTAMVTLPRLIVSLHGGRFFLAQAIIPALLIAIARGWIRFSIKRTAQLTALVLAIVFVPPLTRGDAIFGQGDMVRFFAAGSSLRLFQDNQNLDLSDYCDPLLVSLTAKLIPWNLIGACVLDDYAGLQHMPATLDRILTVNDPASFDGTTGGTGSNFLLELFLFGGLPALLLGSLFFGFSCSRFWVWLARPSLFAGIWAECLTRALFAPRNDLSYVYERIPSLCVATWVLISAVTAMRFIYLGYATPAGPLERAGGAA